MLSCFLAEVEQLILPRALLAAGFCGVRSLQPMISNANSLTATFELCRKLSMVEGDVFWAVVCFSVDPILN